MLAPSSQADLASDKGRALPLARFASCLVRSVGLGMAPQAFPRSPADDRVRAKGPWTCSIHQQSQRNSRLPEVLVRTSQYTHLVWRPTPGLNMLHGSSSL